MTITEVSPTPDGFYNLRGNFPDYPNFRGDAERFEAFEPSDQSFNVGDEVLITARMAEADGVLASFVGVMATIKRIDASAAKTIVDLVWNDGRNSWWVPIELLDSLKTDAKDSLAGNAWSLARQGPLIDSFMPLMDDYIRMPMNNLSRQRADWSQLIICRAVLRLRRQVPNSYEEQLAKGHALSISRTWNVAWSAAYKQP